MGLFTLAVLYVLSRAMRVGVLLVVGGLAGVIGRGGLPLASGLLVVVIAALGVMAVGLAVALPYLPSCPASDAHPAFGRVTTDTPPRSRT